MSEGYGTPIRLLFDTPDNMANAGYSGGMELQALSFALSVERKVGGMPIPFLGGRRFGLDLNLVNSTIIIEGVFTDDDLNRRVSQASKASAQIDFAIRMVDLNSFGGMSPVANSSFANLTGGTGTMTIQNKSGATTTVQFVTSSGSVGHVSGGTVRVQDTSSSTYITPAQLATAVKSAIEAQSSDFTITLSTSTFASSAGNSLLNLQQVSTGPMSSSTNVAFNNNAEYQPYHTNFSGGRNDAGIVKSAGDKVQDLYGILHNTARAGSAILGGIIALGAGIAATAATGGAATAALGGAAFAGGTQAITGIFAVDGDYPIGIQIPYNSTIQAPDGQKYTVRNFLIPTGLGKSVDEKMSQENNQSADVTFDTGDNTTGIQGAIQKFDVSYSAGEQMYTYQMVFAPIDIIM